MEYYYELLENITTGTDSSLILFFVIVAALVLPLYVVLIKDRKNSREHDNKKRALEMEKHDKYIEREREIIGVMREISEVIAKNTAVTESLKSLLQNHGADIKQTVGRIHERVDVIMQDTTQIKTFLLRTERKEGGGTM